MGIATPSFPPVTPHTKGYNSLQFSMSQDYHQGIFSFSNGFERSQQDQQQQQHIAQQIRRDKLRVQGFDPPPPFEQEESTGLPVYETAGMLSEMFNFPSGGGATATELLENQILQSYRNSRGVGPPPAGGAPSAADWFLHRGQGMVVGGDVGDSKINHQISSINADSAAAMQLFLMNPQQQRSPSPSPSSHPPPPPNSTSSTLHMLLPNPSGGPFGQFTYGNNPSEIPGVVEGQGLSLSLSSSLQQMEAAKAEELRMGEGNMLFFGQAPPAQYQLPKSLGVGHSHQLHSPFGAVNMLRNSKYAKAAQELLEEFCSVGRGQFKKNKFRRQNSNNGNPSSNPSGGATTSGGGGNSSKDIPPLSAADRLEHQRRKVKLLSMLDEARILLSLSLANHCGLIN